METILLRLKQIRPFYVTKKEKNIIKKVNPSGKKHNKGFHFEIYEHI